MGICVLSLLLSMPIAAQAVGEGDPVEGGARNPEANQSVELERETEIIANTGIDSYGTRQSNKGAGGGAIYGCRSKLDALSSLSLRQIGDPAFSTPCLRSNNLSSGKAFDLQVNTSNLGGVIQKTNDLSVSFPDAAPFYTNMGAVAKGLNADKVDGLGADEIIAKAKVSTADDCAAGTVTISGGCLETTARDAANFADAAEACAADGGQLTPANVLVAASSEDGIDLSNGELSADISTTTVNGSVEGVTVIVDRNGSLSFGDQTDTTPFRCFTV